jgi:hypothetical protein
VFIKVSYLKRILILTFYFLIGYISLYLILNVVENGGADFSKTTAFWLSLIPSFIMGTGSAFGESTILGYLRNFPKDFVAGWSSGTGLAGVIGALLTLMLKVFEVQPKTLYIAISPVCVVYLIAFFLVDRMHKKYMSNIESGTINVEIMEKIELAQNDVSKNKQLNCRNGIQAFKKGTRFILNLCFVYYLEYVILSGFSERVSKKEYISGDDIKPYVFNNMFNKLFRYMKFFSFAIKLVSSFHVRAW